MSWLGRGRKGKEEKANQGNGEINPNALEGAQLLY